MKVRLDRIAERPSTWSERRRISTEALDRDGLVALGEVFWRGKVEWVGDNYVLSAAVDYVQTLECSRCLKPTERPVSSELDLLVLDEAEQPTEGEYELDETDLGVVYAEDGELDLEPLLLEQLQLNVPMYALCGESCAGLCPTCGADLNRGDCGCDEAPTDSRWSALADLKNRFENS